MKKLFLFLLLSSSIMIVSCSKERLENPPPDDYQNLDAFHNKYRQEEQEFVVDTGSGPCLIIGKMGTKLYNICDSSMFVRKSDSSAISYPYKIKLVEIYPAGDFIFWPLSTVSSGKAIETAAAIRVRAFKDNDELVLVPGRKYSADLDSMKNLVNNMQPYHGNENGVQVDWNPDASSSVTATPDFYSMTVGSLYWTNCARPYSGSGSMTTLSVEAQGTNTQNIEIYLVFKNFKSIVRVENLLSPLVPQGEPVTFIAFALNQKNEYVMHKEDLTLSAGQKVTLDLKPVSETDLVNTINGL